MIPQNILITDKLYEDLNYTIPSPDPIEIVKQRMNENGLMNKILLNGLAARAMFRLYSMEKNHLPYE